MMRFKGANRVLTPIQESYLTNQEKPSVAGQYRDYVTERERVQQQRDLEAERLRSSGSPARSVGEF